MECILRFSGAVRRDPAIDTWLRGQPDELRRIAEKDAQGSRDTLRRSLQRAALRKK